MSTDVCGVDDPQSKLAWSLKCVQMKKAVRYCVILLQNGSLHMHLHSTNGSDGVVWCCVCNMRQEEMIAI